MESAKRKIFITGHRGMVGSAIKRAFENEGGVEIITRSHSELDLMDQRTVSEFIQEQQPNLVILAAAMVGGIKANMSYPAEFLFNNLSIQNNVIDSSYKAKVEKFIFLGSSCIYPKNSPQPMTEDLLLTGELEPTNEGYALAKIAGLKLIEFYKKQYNFNGISLMPCNLYGTNDSFDPEHSHVLSALVKKFADAKNNNSDKVTLWGTGIARREFMHVDDLAHAVLHFDKVDSYDGFINIGCGSDVSIKELAELIAKEVGYKGQINWDSSKPNGMLKKCLDVSKMKNYGFEPKIDLTTGIQTTIEEYLKQS
jgi:GDP-L-fucose synthase